MTEQVGSDALLVGTDDAERERLARILREMGHTVAETSSFQDARHQLIHHPPRVLISDVRLGPFNGVHLAILSRHSPVAGVVLLDDQFDRLLEVQAIQHLALYLVKPVGPSKLSSHVSYILRAKPGS